MMKPLVLLVDDEAPFVETMTKRLSKRDLRIITAYSGEEALELLDKNRNTDVVVLDVKMPGMDGIKTLEKIRNQFPLTEVIMLTGHATVESAIDGMKLGAFDYCLKPIKFEDLLQKMGTAFEKKSTHDKKIRDAKIQELIRYPSKVFDQD